MLGNLNISDVVVHEVFQRGPDRKLITPDYAMAAENLYDEAMTTFRVRVTDALSSKAKAIEMAIRRTGRNSFQQDAMELISLQAPEDFLIESRRVADLLAEAQLHQTIPGGIVIVFRGTTGPSDHPFLGVMKAEVQDGFRRRRDGDESYTEFVADLFLTRVTRLYKIGFMVCNGDDVDDCANWRALVFDHHIVANNRE